MNEGLCIGCGKSCRSYNGLRRHENVCQPYKLRISRIRDAANQSIPDPYVQNEPALSFSYEGDDGPVPAFEVDHDEEVALGSDYGNTHKDLTGDNCDINGNGPDTDEHSQTSELEAEDGEEFVAPLSHMDPSSSHAVCAVWTDDLVNFLITVCTVCQP
jgi:hypothetical protein